ncbi:TolC family protein [Nostoc sp.]|uniref:TolC family protein n=1 Tax=Nostoc sp. TaxID=1180 RepID=UPI002FF72B06
MNFSLLFVHSTWVRVALAVALPSGIAILFPTLAGAATPLKPQNSPTSVQVPDYLNPNPNPLQFPTKPEEVKIQKTVSISLAQALELAQRNNRDLQVAILQLEGSRSALRQSQAALFPTLGISSNVTNSGNGFTSNSSPASTSFNASAQLNYNLYTSGNRQSIIQAAEEQVLVNQFNVETQYLTARLNAATQYYNLQQADEQVRISQSAVDSAQASFRDTQAREEAGVGTHFDVLQAQVNLANAQQTLTNAISQQQIARRQLATTLSLSQSVNITAGDPVELAGLWQPTMEETIIQAFQNRPELQQYLAQRNIYEQQRRQALSQLGPQISVVSAYNLLDRFNDGMSITDGYSAGIQASLTLFDGGAARASADQSKANIAIAETQFASQRDQIRFNVEQYYFQLQSNLKNVQTSTLALSEAKEALDIARLSYEAGVNTQTDVIAAESALTTAEGNRVTAIVNYNLALANLQILVTDRALR